MNARYLNREHADTRSRNRAGSQAFLDSRIANVQWLPKARCRLFTRSCARIPCARGSARVGIPSASAIPVPHDAGRSGSRMKIQITVEIHVGTIDPNGIGSDEDHASCTEYVLDAVRAAYPGADVRAVGNGGRTSAVDAEGRDITEQVLGVVGDAYDAWCAQ